MSRPVIILAAGGHGRVLLDALRRIGGHDVRGFSDAKRDLRQRQIGGLPVICNDIELLDRFGPNDVDLVNGIGMLKPGGSRAEVFERFRELGYRFLSVVHPNACVGDDVQLGEGVQILAGAVIQTGARIGDNVLINSAAVVEHDCIVSAHVHLATRAVLCGAVQVGARTHVGAGSTVIQGMQIGMDVMLGAGSVVTTPLRDGAKAFGVPARERDPVCDRASGHDPT